MIEVQPVWFSTKSFAKSRKPEANSPKAKTDVGPTTRTMSHTSRHDVYAHLVYQIVRVEQVLPSPRNFHVSECPDCSRAHRCNLEQTAFHTLCRSTTCETYCHTDIQTYYLACSFRRAGEKSALSHATPES